MANKDDNTQKDNFDERSTIPPPRKPPKAPRKTSIPASRPQEEEALKTAQKAVFSFKKKRSASIPDFPKIKLRMHKETNIPPIVRSFPAYSVARRFLDELARHHKLTKFARRHGLVTDSHYIYLWQVKSGERPPSPALQQALAAEIPIEAWYEPASEPEEEKPSKKKR